MEADRQWERRVRQLLKMPRNHFLLMMVVNEYPLGEGTKARQLLTLFIKNIHPSQPIQYLIFGQGVVEKRGTLRGHEEICINVTSDKGDNKIAVVTAFNAEKNCKMVNLVSKESTIDESLVDDCDFRDYVTYEKEKRKLMPLKWFGGPKNGYKRIDEPIDGITECPADRRAEAQPADVQLKVGATSHWRLKGESQQSNFEVTRLAEEKMRDCTKPKGELGFRVRPPRRRTLIIKTCATFVRNMIFRR